jgi:hypothetical protein
VTPLGTVVFPAMVIALAVAWWYMIYSAPWTLSLLLPRRGLFFAVGFAVFAAGIAGAAIVAYSYRQPGDFIGALLTAFWGGWLMLAPTAALRSTPEDEDMMERLALMLVTLLCVLVLSFYSSKVEVITGMQLWLVLMGAFIALRGVGDRRRRR